jgi:hypothetical protein
MAIHQTFETDPYAAELKANVLNVFESGRSQIAAARCCKMFLILLTREEKC